MNPAVVRISASNVGLIVTIAFLALAAGLLLASEWGSDFLAHSPGTVLVPSAPVGIPAWLAWQHSLNLLFLVLIVRTGLNIRSKQRPPAARITRWVPEALVRRLHSIVLWWLVRPAVVIAVARRFSEVR